MPRKQTLIVQCDRDGCRNIGEVEAGTGPSDAPKGWVSVTVEHNEKYDPHLRFEFCGERCVGIWANARHKHLKAEQNNGQVADDETNDYESTRKRPLGLTRQQVLNAAEVTDGDFTFKEIADLLESEPNPPTINGIRSMLDTLANEGAIRLVEKDRFDRDGGTGGRLPNLYRKVG